MNKLLFIPIMLLSNFSMAASFVSDHNSSSEEISKSVEDLLNMGQFQEARNYLNAILETQSNNAGKDSPDYLKTLSLLANVYKYMGDYGKSLEFYSSYIKSGAKVLANDPFQVVILNNLTNLMVALGRYDEAQEYCDKAKKINRTPDELHANNLRTLSNEADIYLARGKNEAAQKLYEYVLEAQLKLLGEMHPDYIATLVGLTTAYMNLAMFAESKENLERWLKLSSEVEARELPLLGEIYDNLGVCMNCLTKFSESLKHFERAQKIKIKFLGEAHPSSLRTKQNIALLYRGLDRFIESKKLLLEVQSAVRKSLGEMHPTYIYILDGLASVCKTMGNFEEAVKYSEEALRLGEKVFADHSFLAQLINNRGSLYKILSMPKKALEMYEKALDLHMKLLGPAHPNTLIMMSNVATIYSSIGQFDKALACHEATLKLKEQVLGHQHPSVAKTLNNIGVVYQAKGDFNKALPYFQEQQKIIVALFGEEHSENSYCLQNIAVTNKSLKNYDDAVKSYKKALTISQKLFGPDHHTTATSFNDISVVYFLLEKHKKAFKYAEKALEIRKKCFSSAKMVVNFIYNGMKLGFEEVKHADVATSYYTIGFFYHRIAFTKTDKEKIEYLAKAEYFYRIALEMRKALLNEDHPDISMTMNNLAVVCQAQGKFQEALEVHLKALENTIKIFGKDHLNTAISHNNLGSISVSLQHFDEASEYFNNALRIRNIHLSPNHPDVVAVVSQLAGVCHAQANVLCKQNNERGALELFEARLGQLVSMYGKDYVGLVSMLDQFLSFCSSIGWYHGAAKHCLRVVEIREKSLEPNPSDLISAMKNLGVSFHNIQEYKKAIETYFKALKIAVEHHGKANKIVGELLREIAITYKAMMQNNMAILHFEWALDVFSALKDPECANVLIRFGDLYSEMAQYPESAKCYEEAADLSLNPVEKKRELMEKLRYKMSRSYVVPPRQ